MEFKDIAAYQDSLVPGFIRRILASNRFKSFLDKIPALPQLFKKESKHAVLEGLKSIRTVADFQKLMAFLLHENIKATTDSFTYDGIENLPADQGMVLLSNHRSIGLDAAYTNYCFFQEGRSTVYNGCGDNIMKTSWLGHLIRINKGFVVKRNVSDVEMKLNEISRLSQYIKSLLDEQKSIWIAHRGGRAKDGIDATDSVVLAMLYKESGHTDWHSWSENNNLIPLSISWEISPCDMILSHELAQEHYRKPMHRDFSDIMSEIGSQKGRVHIHFGERVIGNKRKEIVEKLDRAIQTGYRLWDANWLAYSESDDCSPEDAVWIRQRIDMDRGHKVLDRGSVLEPAAREKFLAIYSNPVRQALTHVEGVQTLLP